MRNLLFISVLICVSLHGCAQNAKKNSPVNEPLKTEKMSDHVNKSEEEWKKELTPEQYHILREKGTERPFTGKYWDTKEKGVYCCAACGAELFSSDQKFDSECGWPSFDAELGKGEKIIKKQDLSFGMMRTEIICAKCGGHLGHIFDDGPTTTGKRYCVNSASLNLIKK